MLSYLLKKRCRSLYYCRNSRKNSYIVNFLTLIYTRRKLLLAATKRNTCWEVRGEEAVLVFVFGLALKQRFLKGDLDLLFAWVPLAKLFIALLLSILINNSSYFK